MIRSRIAREEPPDQLLAVAVAVHVGGVVERDADVGRGMERAHAGRVVDLAPAAADGPRAEADGADVVAGLAQSSVLHRSILPRRHSTGHHAADRVTGVSPRGTLRRSSRGTAVDARDFPVSRVLWVTTLAECVVLGVAGIGLLVVPDLMTPLWPWPLSPFTARALGAVYLAAFAATVSLGNRPWWSPARVVVPMVAVFTTIT